MKLTSATSGGEVQQSVRAQEQLKAKAQEFEGILLAQMLEKLKEAYRIPGAEEEDPARSSMESLATSALGGGLAQQGGLGVAEMIVRSLATDPEAGVGKLVRAPHEVLRSPMSEIKAFQ